MSFSHLTEAFPETNAGMKHALATEGPTRGPGTDCVLYQVACIKMRDLRAMVQDLFKCV